MCDAKKAGVALDGSCFRVLQALGEGWGLGDGVCVLPVLWPVKEVKQSPACSSGLRENYQIK